MTEDELNELEYLRAWNEDLTEEQFNRLKTLEVMAAKVPENNTLQEIEGMRSDARPPLQLEERTPDAPPFLTRTPRTSEIIAESTKDGKMGPIAYKRFVEDENELLKNKLAAIPEKASSYRGTELLRSDIGNTTLGLIAPAVAEAYANDRVPGITEGLVDLGILGASLYATPARGAALLSKGASGSSKASKIAKVIAPSTNAWKNAAVEGATSGAISGLGELAQSEFNDRDYMLSAPLLGAGVGGVLGGSLTAPQARKLADMGFSGEEIPDILSKLSTSTERTRKAINPGGKKDFGSTEIKGLPELTKDPSGGIVGKDITFRGSNGKLVAETVYPKKEVLSKISDIRNSLSDEYTKGMPFDTYQKKLDMLQTFEDKVNTRSDFLAERELRRYVSLLEQTNSPFSREMLTGAFDEAAKNPKVYGSGLLNDIQDVSDPTIRTSLLQAIPKDKKLVAPLLQEAKYAAGVEKAPKDAGSLWQEVKNLSKAPPHVSKTAQQAARPAARTLPQVGRDTDEDGNLLYAPYGQQTYEWLWEQASKGKR